MLRLRAIAEGSKKIRYECRKVLADSRPRVKGRFAKANSTGCMEEMFLEYQEAQYAVPLRQQTIAEEPHASGRLRRTQSSASREMDEVAVRFSKSSAQAQGRPAVLDLSSCGPSAKAQVRAAGRAVEHIFACAHMHIHACIHAPPHTHTCIHANTHPYTCMHMQAGAPPTPTPPHTCTHAHVHKHAPPP